MSVKRIVVLGSGFAGLWSAVGAAHKLDELGCGPEAVQGSWGAVYTEGWDRHVVTKGAAAKKTKLLINCQRIYPPLTRNRQEILAAAAPVVQEPPKTYH